MESFLEKILIYSVVGLFLVIVFYIYVRKLRRESKIVDEKIKLAKEEGLYEPVSLHPVVDVNSCIQSGACIRACPEHDIFGNQKRKSNSYKCESVCRTRRLFSCLPNASYFAIYWNRKTWRRFTACKPVL